METVSLTASETEPEALQFSHGTEAVETNVLGLTPICFGMLQFSHGTEAVETLCHGLEVADV